MSTYDELREEVHRFLSGEPLLRLREGVERYDEPISASEDARFRELSADVWALLSEYDLGERTEGDVRTALASQHADLLQRRTFNEHGHIDHIRASVQSADDLRRWLAPAPHIRLVIPPNWHRPVLAGPLHQLLPVDGSSGVAVFAAGGRGVAVSALPIWTT